MLSHRKIIYSQYGEEGILEYLIKSLKLDNLHCCEFGMTRKINSNTFYFVENFDCYGVYIDNNIERLKTLQRENTTLICTTVEVNGKNRLDKLLSNTILPKDFDILSIDIDGKDYLVWQSLADYSPKIVVIEINPFLGAEQEYINDGKKFSSSFKSTVKLGESKGYKLVCMTGNLIFVKKYLLENTHLNYLLTVDDNELFLNDVIVSQKNKKAFTFERYIDKTII